MTLSVCATPIGNLDDITLRVLHELREADLVLCEDTRRTRVLLDRHGIRAARLLSYHEHNEAKRVAELVPRLEAGERIALVSDAGLPGVSDPGARLVDAALAAGVEVTVLPGPSAPETAVVASGLAADGYVFVGFLPRKAGELEALLDRTGATGLAIVGFESPKRLSRTLATLAALDADRRVAVCRELTKLHEEVVRASAAELAEQFAGTEPRGEIVVVLAPGSARVRDVAEAASAVDELVGAGVTRRDAARVVARLTGSSANDLYRSSLDRAS